jgi:dipeptidyl aminopeptidase/acylaminoacyl peptidase
VRRFAAFFVLVMVAGGCASDGSSPDDGAAGCSAAELQPDLSLDETLPEPVARTEVAVVRAAVACDSDRLESLADFELNDPTLPTLVELFEGPVVLDGDAYVWPGVEENGPRTAIAADGTWLSYGTGENGANVLAATYTGRLVLLGPDGSELRDLGEVAPDDASNGFAVSPDGRFAYFDRGGLPACEAEVVRLNLKSGRERTITTGSQPALSPDGRRLAHLTCRNGSSFSDQIVVRRLKSGKEQVVDAGGVILANPSWAPDSEHLAVQLPDPGAEIRVLDLDDDEPFAEAEVVELESVDNTFWAGYRGATGEFFALTAPGGEAGSASPLPVIAIDADTGRTLGPLFSVDAQCCVVDLAADRAGTTVLAAGTNDGVVVWGEGETATTPLASDVRRAAWVPSGA